MSSTFLWVVLVVYLLFHGACFAIAIRRLLDADPNRKRGSSEPWFSYNQDKLITIAFIFGPVGLLAYLLVYTFMPQSQKTWLH